MLTMVFPPDVKRMFGIRAATNVIYKRLFDEGVGNCRVSELQQHRTSLKLRPSAMSTLPVLKNGLNKLFDDALQ